MQLKTKVTLIILLIWSILLVATYFQGERILSNSYLNLEQRKGLDNANEITEVIDRMVNEVSAMAAFWSIFDSAYEYMGDRNEEYIKTTVQVTTLGKADLDMMLYYDIDGKLVYGLTVDPERSSEVPMPEGLEAYLDPKGKLVHQPNVDSSAKGIIAIPAGIFLVASHAIVKSDGTGPVRGTEVLARRFTDETIKKIADQTNLNLELYRLNKIEKQPELKNIYNDLIKSNQPIINIEKNKNKLNGYILLKDINNLPIAIIKLSEPLDVYKAGINTMYYFYMVFLAFGLIFIGIIIYLLRSLIIKRIEILDNNIISISDKKQFSLRVNEDGSDELTSVEKEMNKMLSVIDEYSQEKKKLINQVSNELEKANKFAKKLEEAEHLLSNTISFMPSLLVITNKDFKITHLNSIAEKFIGKNLDDVKDKSIFELFPHINNYKNIFLKSYENQTKEMIDRVTFIMDGDKHHFNIIVYPFDISTGERGLAIRIDDITDKENLENKLRQNDKLSSVGVLTAGIAHEITHPIKSISVALNALKISSSHLFNLLDKYLSMNNQKIIHENTTGNYYTESNNEINKSIELIDEIVLAANQINEMVNNLRSFVRMDEDMEKNVNIHDGINSILSLIKYKCQDRIKITKIFGNIPEIECVPGKINQVFMNIITNAIDAIPNDGEITIKTYYQNDNIIISVKDNGVGISEENKSKIFDPSFTTKKSGIDVGLGLPISLGIIRELHGLIKFESQLGKGTEFIISLPISKRKKYI